MHLVSAYHAMGLGGPRYGRIEKIDLSNVELLWLSVSKTTKTTPRVPQPVSHAVQLIVLISIVAHVLSLFQFLSLRSALNQVS